MNVCGLLIWFINIFIIWDDSLENFLVTIVVEKFGSFTFMSANIMLLAVETEYGLTSVVVVGESDWLCQTCTISGCLNDYCRL